MTKQDTINKLIKTLTEIDSAPRSTADCSEAGNRRIMQETVSIVHNSDLDEVSRKQVIRAIHLEANPSGYYYTESGVKAGLEALRAVLNELDTQDMGKQESPLINSINGLNVRNLRNLVSDGSIFYVEFVKRTTGERRMMRCRTGVKKYLKGGKRAYSAASKGLLPVFDMNAKGYRSIPVEAIQALSVNGQSFNFAGV